MRPATRVARPDELTSESPFLNLQERVEQIDLALEVISNGTIVSNGLVGTYFTKNPGTYELITIVLTKDQLKHVPAPETAQFDALADQPWCQVFTRTIVIEAE